MHQITAKVERIDLEGGFWGIIDMDTKKKYLPDEELPIIFQQNGLMVNIVFEPSTMSSAFQWGRMIHILRIEKVE